MTEEQIQDTFETYGHQEMFHRFQTALYVTGLLDEVEEEQLEGFFDNMEVSPDIFFDEFRFWFQYYAVAERQL